MNSDDMYTDKFTFVNGIAVVHPATKCDPSYPCNIHRPSEHGMRGWPQLLRETGLTERLCEHGVGHPDPDSAAYFNRLLNHPPGTWETHGCDSCCHGKWGRDELS